MYNLKSCPVVSMLFSCVCGLTPVAVADDWPTFLHDARRSAVTPERLPLPLHPQWVFQSRHAPEPAWADPQPKPVEGNLELPRLRFDDAWHVVTAGDMLYFASSADHGVHALDVATGAPRWSFTTGAPVRLAPSIWQGRLYVGSDDGAVYCLDAATGARRWRFQAAPHPDRILGNGRLISLWPVRTSVLVADGVAYFGAGVFPAEGLHLYAVDAETGELVWKNDSYDEGGIAEITPQGYLLASEQRLYVPSGRAVPVVFDRATGLELYQTRLNWRRDGLFGGTYALLAGDYLYNGTEQILAYRQDNGKLDHAFPAHRLVATGERSYLMTGTEILAVDPLRYPQACQQQRELEEKRPVRRRLRQALPELGAQLAQLKPEDNDQQAAKQDAIGKKIAEAHKLISEINALETQTRALLAESVKWRVPFAGSDALALAGDVLFAAGGDRVAAIDTAGATELWSATVTSRARGLAIANGRLYVSTDAGHIHCFAAGPAETVAKTTIPETINETPLPDDQQAQFCRNVVEAIVSEAKTDRGYAIILGGDVRLALELAGRTRLNILLVEPDPDTAAAARATLTAAGLSGARVSVDQRPLCDLSCPPYFANLVVAGDSLTTGLPATPAGEILHMLKPHGGVAFAGRPLSDSAASSPGAADALGEWLAGFDDGSTDIQRTGSWARITRGALPGSGNWTHQYANPANTTCGDDTLVKGPLGLLWFGEPGPTRMPSRHASNVAPLLVDGRFFAQGENVVMAYDAYNGLELWQRDMPGALRLQMGFTSETSNLAASHDSLFIAIGRQCHRLDPATGETLRTYNLPESLDAESAAWGYIAYDNGTLYGSRTDKGRSSSALFALDIQTGLPRWIYDNAEILHDSIAIGDGRLWLVDKKVTDAHRQAALAGRDADNVDRKGQPDVRLVVALDATTGNRLWEQPMDVSDCVKIGRTGGELSAIYARNVLLLFGAPWNGHFWTEFLSGQFSRRSLIALAGDTGRKLWSGHIGYRSRPIVVGDTIYAEPWAHDLHTGKPKMRIHPVTGAETPWQMARPGHHCGCIAASPNCLFFRSYSTGFYDLLQDYGVAHYGAQRPGCWINFIPAGGVVCIPEASSGCVCPFPLHCTITMYPRDLNRVWGMYSAVGDMTPVRRLGINFGAPGDRKDAAGNLWLGYPRPRRDRLVMDLDLKDELHPQGVYYCHDEEGRRIHGAETTWLYASWCRGFKQCSIPLLGEGDPPRAYTVRLHFAELDDVPPGGRVFNVCLQGRQVLAGLDVAAAAGGPGRALVREFSGVQVKDRLGIALEPVESSGVPIGIISAVEVLAEP